MLHKKYETAMRWYIRNKRYVAANLDSLHWRKLAVYAKTQDQLYLQAQRLKDEISKEAIKK